MILFFFSVYSFNDTEEKFGFLTVLSAKEAPQRVKNYLKLHDMFVKWQDGFFGSRKSSRRLLYMYLVDLIGQEIETGYNYYLVCDGDLENKKVKSKFRDERWLNFHGPVDISELENIARKDPTILKKWWRSKVLVSVSGKIRKFRIGKDRSGDTIELYLTKIKVSPVKKISENKKNSK